MYHTTGLITDQSTRPSVEDEDPPPITQGMKRGRRGRPHSQTSHLKPAALVFRVCRIWRDTKLLLMRASHCLCLISLGLTGLLVAFVGMRSKGQFSPGSSETGVRVQRECPDNVVRRPKTHLVEIQGKSKTLIWSMLKGL